MKSVAVVLLVALYTVSAKDCFYDSYSLISPTNAHGAAFEKYLHNPTSGAALQHKPDVATASACKAYCYTKLTQKEILTDRYMWQFVYAAKHLDGCYCLNLDDSQVVPLNKGEKLVGGPVNVADCFYDTYYYNGDAAIFHDGTIESPLHCRDTCNTVPGAQNWQFFAVYTWAPKWGQCYCGVNEPSTLEAVPNKNGLKKMIGGSVVGAPELPAVPTDCYHVGKDHPGHNLSGPNNFYILTAQFCQVKCQQTHGCKGFSWSPGHCWLKSSVAPKMTTDHAVTSGPVECK